MIFLDTGFFLAVSQPKDQLHARASAWARVIEDPLFLTEYVIWETVNAMSSPEDRIKAHQLFKYIQSAKNYIIIPASQELFQAGMQLHEARPDKAWSLTDCISFVFMERQGIRRALAFDHHFTQAGFEALLRHDPP